MLNNALGWFSTDLAIDLGTANTLLYAKGRGIVCNEPSVVVMRRDNRKVIAVGIEAKKMLGKTPADIEAVKPLKGGVIADFDSTQEMLKYFMKQAINRMTFSLPRVIIGVPSGITQVAQRAIKDAVKASGAREVYLVGEPIAAAIGVGLPVGEPFGNMIVDIGGGTTDIAVISLDGVVCSKAIDVGGDKMDEAILDFIKRRYNLLIGDRTAEHIKITIGAACETGRDGCTMEIKGRDIFSGIPKTITIHQSEVRKALADPVNAIVDTIKMTLEDTPPELGADILDRGIVLAGGGALLGGLDRVIQSGIGISVIVAEDPLAAVIRGVGKILDDLDLIKRVAMN
jgi:rod shape-determining protein MreB